MRSINPMSGDSAAETALNRSLRDEMISAAPFEFLSRISTLSRNPRN